MKTERLGTGKTVSVVKHHGGHHIRIEGEGSHAVLMPAEAAALYGALRQFDNAGLLEDEL